MRREPAPRVPRVPQLPRVVGGGAGVRERAERLVQSVIARKRRIAEEFYAMGVELGELARPELHTALGFASFAELIEGRKIMSRMTALKLMSVAAAFPRGLAMELGLDRAYALVRYAEATPAPDVARVLAERNATVGGKRVSEATAGEIEAETKRIRSGGRVKDTKDPPAREARGAAREVQTAIRRVGAARAAARLVEVARTFTREQAVSLGLEKAFALARYVAATPADDIAGALADADARIGGKRLSEISGRDLTVATQELRRKGRRKVRDPLEAAARKAARAAQAALRKTGARGVSADATRRNGEWVVRIEVPVEAIGVITNEGGREE